ncbi:MAG: hypothetical protein K2L51_07185, partial [Clostridiales bacterium]|nr:hypothetical protein [Clostridiales bacterium]
WEYDGKAHSVTSPAADSEESVTGLADGDEIAIAYTATITEAGSVPNTFTAEITRGDEDVSADYELVPAFGTLTVTPQKIGTEKMPYAPTYNGEEIVPTPDLLLQGLTDGQKAVLYVHTFETVKHAKTYRYEVCLSDTRNYTLAGDPTGSFTVLPAELRGITYAGETKKVYDGKPLAFDYNKLNVGAGLYAVGASVQTGNANAGHKTITVNSIVLRNAAGEDVSADYNIGTLTFDGNIAKREIIVAGDALVVEVPPTDLSTCTHLANGTTLADGESYTATVAQKGLTLEVSDVRIVNGREDNYVITIKNGSITYLS